MTMDVMPSCTEDGCKLPFTKKLASFDRMNSGSTWAGNTPVSEFEITELEALSSSVCNAFGLEAVVEDAQETMAVGSSEPVKAAKSAPPEKCRLSKPRAVALQNELLAAYTSARFQKKLQAIARQQGGGKMGSLHRPAFHAALKNLLRKPQMDIISRYGFQASEQGIEEMEMELEFLEEDGDVYVNKVAIEEALFGPFEDLVLEEEPNSGKPSTKQGVYLLLRSLFLGFSEAWFQEAILKLQHKKDARERGNCGDRGDRGGDRGDRDRHRPDPDGYFHLPGRAELALEVQQKILPRFGFDATKEGVGDMIRHCSAFLTDHDIAHLFDAINRKLGMSPAACSRFRRFCSSFQEPIVTGSQNSQAAGSCNLVRISHV